MLVQAFSASIELLNCGEASQQQKAAFERELLDALSDEIIRPLCADIEADLRRHVDSARSNGAPNLETKDIRAFLRVVPLRVAMKEVDIRSLVAHCLNASFYRSAVSLDSLKTYEEMRSLAIDKYGLPLAEIELHGHAGDEAMDVLEAIRDTHRFVVKYSLNLNSQCFVDRTAGNAFGIQHVASSIRTHGIGITQAAISSVQEYLAQRFQEFSELLCDDKIRSVLGKEARKFRWEQSGSKSFNGASTPARSKEYSMVSHSRFLNFFDFSRSFCGFVFFSVLQPRNDSNQIQKRRQRYERLASGTSRGHFSLTLFVPSPSGALASVAARFSQVGPRGRRFDVS